MNGPSHQAIECSPQFQEGGSIVFSYKAFDHSSHFANVLPLAIRSAKRFPEIP